MNLCKACSKVLTSFIPLYDNDIYLLQHFDVDGPYLIKLVSLSAIVAYTDLNMYDNIHFVYFICKIYCKIKVFFSPFRK